MNTKKIRLICGLSLYARGANLRTRAHMCSTMLFCAAPIWLLKYLSVSDGCSHVFAMEEKGILWKQGWVGTNSALCGQLKDQNESLLNPA